MGAWIGFKQLPFPYDREERAAGESKYPLGKMLRFAFDALTGFSPAPLKLARPARPPRRRGAARGAPAGGSKSPLRRMLRFACDALTGFAPAPLKLASHAGLLLSAGSL